MCYYIIDYALYVLIVFRSSKRYILIRSYDVYYERKMSLNWLIKWIISNGKQLVDIIYVFLYSLLCNKEYYWIYNLKSKCYSSFRNSCESWY